MSITPLVAWSYPIDAPGYVLFTGDYASYLSVADNNAYDITGDITVVAKIRPEAWVPTGSNQCFAAKWGNTGTYSWGIQIQATTGFLTLLWSTDGTATLSKNSTASLSTFPLDWLWVAFTLDVVDASNHTVRFWTKLDEDDAVWVALGTPVSTAGATSIHSGIGPLTIGSLGAANPFSGAIGYVSIRSGIGAGGTVGGAEVFRFDGNADLAGVGSDATSFMPSVAPVNSVVTINRKPVAAGQGYVTFPGTSNNYLSIPDAANLDITGPMYLMLRVRHVDATPIVVTTPLSKAGSYRVVATPDGLTFSWSTDGGTTWLSGTVNSQGTIPNGQWVWYSFYFAPATRAIKMWYALEDLIVPPLAASWQLLGSTTGTATTIFSGVGLGLVGTGTPSYVQGYLTPATGTVSTPDTTAENFGTADFTIVMRIKVGAMAAAAKVIACQRLASTSVAWGVLTTDRNIYLRVSSSGTGYTSATIFGALPAGINTGDTITVACSCDSNNGASGHTITTKLLQGTTWTTIGTATTATALTLFNSTAVIQVGAQAGGTPATYDASIYWVEMRSGLDPDAGAVTWRFDADDYLGTGTVSADPRGRTWTLTNANAITQRAGAAPGWTADLAFEGDIGYASIKNGGTGGTPLEGNAVFTLDANSLVGVDPAATSFIASPPSQTITVTRSPLPKDDGFVLLPGTVGNDLMLAHNAKLNLAGRSTITVCITPETWRPFEDQTIISKWATAGQRSYALMLDTAGRPMFLYSIDGSAYTTVRSSAPLPVTQGFLWLRVTTNTDGTNRSAVFETSLDRITWTPLGVPQLGPPGTIFVSNSPLILGARYEGRIHAAHIYDAAAPVSNAFTLASEHIPADPAATAVPTPSGILTVHRAVVPVDFGYFVFPGTIGNYLSVPNSAPLQTVNKFVVEARLIPDDWSPAGRDRVIVSKTGAASPALGWRFLLTSQGTLAFEYSTAGTSFNQYMESAPVGLEKKYAKRVAFSMDATTGFGNFWTSDDNLTWTRLGTDLPFSGSPFVTTAPMLIGDEYDGAISNVSFRTSVGSGGVPLQGTEVLLIDQACLGIDDDATSFVATTGQTVTIVRTPSATEYGWVTMPGTEGNYLTSVAAGFPAITGSITFMMRIAANHWLGQRVLHDPDNPQSEFHYEGSTQTICGRWATGNFSYLLRLSPAGEFLFSWVSADGLTEYTSTSVPVSAPAEGEFRFLAVTMEMGATQTLRLYETSNFGDTWQLVGSPVVTTYPATALRTGTAPLLIGAQDVANNIFGGRLSYLSIHNGTGTNGVPGGVEAFRIDADSLRINEASLNFIEETGKTVVLQQSFTPVITGYVAFGGVVDEFCRVAVPALSTMTSDFSILVRIDFTDVPLEEEEQVIISKWPSFSLRRLENVIIFQTTQNGTDLAITAALSDAWEDEQRWGWLAITVNYKTEAPNAGATVSFWTAPDARNTYDTPLVPVSSDWVLQGDSIFYDDVTATFMDTAQVTIGGQGDGTMPLKANISNVSIRNGVGADNRPGGTELFGYDIDSFFGITGDSDAFTAETGENVVLEPVGAERTMVIVPSPPGPITSIEASPPGTTTEILPAPVGPTTEFVRGAPGPVVVITPSPVGPTTEIVPASIDSPWWPGTTQYPEDSSKWWPQPAFSVQRSIRGVITGGDYVRGSTNLRTQKTAIRFPTSLPGWTAAGVGKGVLYSRPINYGTIEIEWNVPQQLIDNNVWLEVAIIRAAMGYPATVNDGQAIFRMSKSKLYPNGYVYDDEDPPRLLTPNVWDPQDPETSGGIPGLPPGRWYYYGLFFKIGQDWVRSAIHNTLLPRNHHHSDHLWYSLPPYYRWLDDQQRGGANDGDLKRWLSIFGYDLDLTREYVESVLHLYQTDFTPSSLLRRLGDNFGVPYEPGIGDVCYRALVSRIGYLYRGRGTVGGLRSLIAAVSKCDCDVTMAGNVLLLPDDSQFVGGTGNWAGIHPGTIIPPHETIPADPLPASKVLLSHGTFGYLFGPSDGDGMMHVSTLPADATADIILTCGDGIAYDMVPPRELFPLFTATPVDPGSLYGFAIQVRTELVGPKVQPHVLFFDRDGLPVDYVGRLTALPVTLTTTDWVEASVGGQAPPTAAYVVPALGITDRVAGSDPDRSPEIHFCGAQVYFIGTATEGAVAPFIRFLQLTGPPPQVGKKIGPVREAPPFEPYIMGDDE